MKLNLKRLSFGHLLCLGAFLCGAPLCAETPPTVAPLHGGAGDTGTRAKARETVPVVTGSEKTPPAPGICRHYPTVPPDPETVALAQTLQKIPDDRLIRLFGVSKGKTAAAAAMEAQRRCPAIWPALVKAERGTDPQIASRAAQVLEASPGYHKFLNEEAERRGEGHPRPSPAAEAKPHASPRVPPVGEGPVTHTPLVGRPPTEAEKAADAAHDAYHRKHRPKPE